VIALAASAPLAAGAATVPLAAAAATMPLATAAASGSQAPGAFGTQAAAASAIQAGAVSDRRCAHCGLPAPSGRRFCCPGCAAAFATIEGLGLGRYYASRVLDPAQRPPRPETDARWDLARHVVTQPDGTHALTLAIDGLQCGACVWLIEQVLAREPDVTQGRVNMTTRRLRLAWRGGEARAAALVARIEALGYRLVPFDATLLGQAQDATGAALLRALAVAGFAAGNVMLISIGIWAGLGATMGPATLALMHWVSALIAMPAIAYAGRPFFASALGVLRHGRTNMDVPVSLGVLLVTSMSLVATITGGEHTYFDSAITLVFFLLIGRVLDHRARGQARATAEQLLALRAADVAVLLADGSTQRRAQESVAQGDRVLVGMGERIGVDGTLERGETLLDASLVTGESLPVAAAPGTAVFAGTVNLGAPITVRATAAGGATLLAECVRLIEAAEARRSRFVVFADRVARRYAPAVHLTALGTFLFWYVGRGVGLEQALFTASAVLIITCPCALALAVPAVQVIVTSRLLRAGVLLKSPTALERLATVDTVVFDKTGTLTEPTPGLLDAASIDPAALRLAASLAACSRHPLARALAAAAGAVPAAEQVTEYPGQGLRLATAAGEVRLGSRAFCGDPAAPPSAAPELWLARPGQAKLRFGFDERPRSDARETLERLRRLGLRIELLSGDRRDSVARIAGQLGIADWRAECSPLDKVARVERMAARHCVLMVGDGLNDSPALAAATVSASPASAADLSQTVADVVFQGARLAPVAAVIRAARRARAVMRQNLALAIGYNALMVPLAVAGWVTPWLAAAAMSSSSLLVMANSFRAARGERTWR
jgi:Cu2+-exporting ATPase